MKKETVKEINKELENLWNQIYYLFPIAKEFYYNIREDKYKNIYLFYCKSCLLDINQIKKYNPYLAEFVIEVEEFYNKNRYLYSRN